jgi:hypothetical protein
MAYLYEEGLTLPRHMITTFLISLDSLRNRAMANLNKQSTLSGVGG